MLLPAWQPAQSTVSSESQFCLQSAPSRSSPPHCSWPCPPGLLPRRSVSEQSCTVLHLTSMVVLVDFFFNSLVVRVPCSLIFWHFWLFIDFRLVVILLLLVVRGSTGFLPTLPSWPNEFVESYFCSIMWSVFENVPCALKRMSILLLWGKRFSIYIS